MRLLSCAASRHSLEAARQNDKTLDRASAEPRGDRYVIQEAVRHNRRALGHASEELNTDCDDGGTEGSKAEWQSFGAALAGLRSDHDEVLKAVSRMATPRSMLPQSFAAIATRFWKREAKSVPCLASAELRSIRD